MELRCRVYPTVHRGVAGLGYIVLTPDKVNVLVTRNYESRVLYGPTTV